MADDLTNLKFDAFDLDARVRWRPEEQSWCVLEKFMKHAREFHDEMKRKKSQPAEPPPKKRKGDKGLGPW